MPSFSPDVIEVVLRDKSARPVIAVHNTTGRLLLLLPAETQETLITSALSGPTGVGFALGVNNGVATWVVGGDGSLASTAPSEQLRLGGFSAGAATMAARFTKKVTAIADAAATSVLTVTVPNGEQAAALKIGFLTSNGAAAAFQSSRCAEGLIVIARTTGVATVAVASALANAAIATVAAGATHTLAYSVTAMTGGVGATQTFDVQVTIDDSSNVGGNQCVMVVELLNAQVSGVSVA